MCVPARIRYQHEQSKIRTKIRRAEKRKHEKKINQINDIREELKSHSKKMLYRFNKLLDMKEQIKNEIEQITKKVDVKLSKKKQSKKRSKSK